MIENDKKAKFMQTHNWIAYYRKKADLKQEELVARLAKYGIFVDRSAISHWESGTEPNFSTLLALAEIFKIKVDDFKPRYMVEKPEEKVFNSKDAESILNALKSVNEVAKAERFEYALNMTLKEREYLKNGGLYEVSIDDIYRKAGYSDAFYYINIHHLPIVADAFKRRGYIVQTGEVNNISNSYFYVAIAGGEDEAKKFEYDYATIISELFGSLREKENQVIKNAVKIGDEYVKKIDSLMSDVCYDKNEKIFNGEYVFTYGEDKKSLSEMDDIFSVSGKANLFKLLETVKPRVFWVNGMDGMVKWENYEKFKTAFKKDNLPKHHIYCVNKKDDEYYIVDELFLNEGNELADAIKDIDCDALEISGKRFSVSELGDKIEEIMKGLDDGK